MKKCVALVSGGMDSMCYLAQQIGRYEILPLVFNYGQIAHKEIEVACHILEAREGGGLRQRRIVRMESFGGLCSTQLTGSVPVSRGYEPSVVVPLRSFIFLMVAAAHAKSTGATRVIAGIHTEDQGTWLSSPYPMYPDRMAGRLRELEEDIHTGHFWWTGDRVEIWTPAREGMSKAANLKKGMEVLGNDVYQTWSCHGDGGRQCGECLSCRERKAAFGKAGIEDKTEYKK